MSLMNHPNSFDLVVDQPTLASYLDIEPGSVSRLALEGMPKIGRNQYPLGPCIQFFLRRLKDRSLDSPCGLNDERLLLIRAQCEAQELENAANRAALLDAGFAREAAQQLVELACAPLDDLQRLAPEIAKLRDPAAISRVLFDACREARREAAADVQAFAVKLAADDPAA